jgi:hypothetical protein
MMDDFERQLENALSRREPPPWLESKILAAVKEQLPAEQPGFWERIAPWLRLRWIPAVVAVCLIVTGIAWQREKTAQERAAGESAKVKLELALKVTSVKLQKIKRLVDTVNQNN